MKSLQSSTTRPETFHLALVRGVEATLHPEIHSGIKILLIRTEVWKTLHSQCIASACLELDLPFFFNDLVGWFLRSLSSFRPLLSALKIYFDSITHNSSLILDNEPLKTNRLIRVAFLLPEWDLSVSLTSDLLQRLSHFVSTHFSLRPRLEKIYICHDFHSQIRAVGTFFEVAVDKMSRLQIFSDYDAILIW